MAGEKASEQEKARTKERAQEKAERERDAEEEPGEDKEQERRKLKRTPSLGPNRTSNLAMAKMKSIRSLRARVRALRVRPRAAQLCICVGCVAVLYTKISEGRRAMLRRRQEEQDSKRQARLSQFDQPPSATQSAAARLFGEPAPPVQPPVQFAVAVAVPVSQPRP